MNAIIGEIVTDDAEPIDNKQQLMPRATAEQIVAQRNAALNTYAEAYRALQSASDKIAEACNISRQISPRENAYNYHIKAEKVQFHHPLKVDDRDVYMAMARRLVDTSAWAHVIELTDLETLMDKKAKDEFRQQLMTDPPEFTLENLLATIQTFAADAGTIFKRGIAECFSNLDRRFRSHDGWKIGSRVILSYAFDENGWWNYNRNHRDTIMDIERVFRVVDGEPVNVTSVIYQLENSRRNGHGARQSEVETTYFRIKGYKNGNAHLWFTRDDLVEKVNKLLGEYYGAPIPEDRDPVDDGGLFNPKLTPAKYFGFYPTPDKAAELVMERVPLWRDENDPPLRILEPSAGTGNLARRCLQSAHSKRARSNIVDVVEIQPHLANELRSQRLYSRVHCCDFLAMQPDATDLFDVVVMNPPFDRERDIDHVMHALKFLKPDGVLIAVMSAGTEFRENRKTVAFRDLMTKMNAKWWDLPAGSFSSVGTNCNTVILKVYADRRTFWS